MSRESAEQYNPQTWEPEFNGQQYGKENGHADDTCNPGNNEIDSLSVKYLWDFKQIIVSRILQDSSGIVILFKGTTDIYQLIRVEDLQIKKNKGGG